MTKLVVLKLDGDLQQGVRVTLSIATEGVSPHKEVTGNLPPVTELQTKIDQWRSHYRSLGSSTRGIKAIKVTYSGSITQKYEDCKNSATELQKRLNNWLLSESFRPIRESWLKELQEKELVRVLIRTSSQQLRQIPWHLWDLVEEYPNAELALSATDYQKTITAKTPTKRDKVKILAILGNSTGIDVETDRRLLNSLPDADVTFLVQPQRHEINDSLWERPWDILFFAGHSQTVGDSGRIYINENKESLSTDDLKYGLKKATSNGLAVAIFNSCDGLGLGSELEALQIPQIIVMREQVPDEVAQVFLKHFLVAYANDGKPLYQAVKEARLKLHGLEDKYPCASLLPVICQNADIVPPNWLHLGRRPTEIIPYRSLFAFREKDAQFFFGRESFTDMLMDAVQNQPLVAVIGSSGSGKSSVVFAGLVKRLRDADNWHIVDFRPGSRPLFNLATALVDYKEPHLSTDHYQKESQITGSVLSRTERLREIRNLASDLEQCDNGLRDVVDDILSLDPSQRLLLVADQFEELYTLCRDAQERQAFLDRLLEATNHCGNFTFVITLRADFLGQALSYRPFADALQYADLKLGPMTDEELQAAVEEPAKLLGVTIEEGLAERILSAVSAEPGDLPLLEFALTQLWAKQVDAQLTHAAYDEIGGVEAALARYADEEYNKLNFEEKERAQRIFIQLVRPGEATEDTRRVATRAEVGEENWDLVTRLADARLVVTGRSEKTGLETVEIVHEALIRNWLHLNLWMQLDRDFRHWQEQLRTAMHTWESSSNDEGALLRGKPLADAEYWYSKRLVELSNEERCFIQLSLELRDRTIKIQKRRRQLTIWGLSTGLLFAFSLAGVAGWQWQKARISEINSFRFSAETSLTSNQDFDALITSIRGANRIQKTFGVDTHTRSQLVETLLQAVNFTREYNRLENHIEEGRDSVNDVVFSPDGNIIATASSDKTVKLWSRDGKVLDTLYGHKNGVICVSFSPDGNIIASGSWDNTVRLWSKDGKLIDTLYGHKGGINSISFSPDGNIIATGSWDNTVRLWSRDGKKLKTLRGHKDGVFGVSFSPDGNTIATASGDETVKLWSKEGKELQTLKGHKGGVNSVIFSPDGNTIATAGWDKTIKLWSKEGKQKYSFPAHDDKINKLSFSHDGKIIASATNDKTAKLWSLNGQQLDVLRGHDAIVTSVVFSPDDKQIATASEDKTVKLWNRDSKQLHTLRGHQQLVYSVVFSPDGNTIASASSDNTVKLWSRDGKELHTLRGHTKRVNNVSFSPDGNTIATASEDRTVKLWSRDGNLLKTLSGHQGTVWNVSFSPDGKTIATASADKTVKLWSRDGNLLKTLSGHEDVINTVKFSPDGRMIATGSWDNTVRLWNRDGKELKTLRGHTSGVNSVAFSPDSSIIASASSDNTVRLWNRDGKELKTLPGHRDIVNSVVFSPDGNIIATASSDKIVKLWNRDGTLLRNLRGHDDAVWSVNFSPDGKTLVTGSGDKTVIVWNSYLEDLKPLLVRACTQVRDYLQNNPNVSPEDRGLCNGI
ncbi:MAG: CHAT domain-containing protein [Hassallia sp. WJT32-NPBG1]|jgi:WD40 repeat protein|nr:CHAT domain-containing protein [Hassallia sp. WJT32-NPBG1]